MDAHAHLKGLGWRGVGYSLDSSDRGLKKPLLVSFKHDERGLGSKSQKEKQADQWWLNAFDSALKDLGTGKTSSLQHIQQQGIRRGGLYSFFQKGEALEGTFSNESSFSGPPEAMAKAEKKRKRTVDVKAVVNSEQPANKRPKTANGAATETAPKFFVENDQQYVMDESNGEKLKVVDGIAIPIPDPIDKKVKEKKEPARKRRAREERERKQSTRMAMMKAKAEAMKNPDFDWQAENRRQVESRITREVKGELRRRELAEEFGPTMPSPADLLQMEKEADKGGPENFPQSRLAALSIKVHGPPKDGVYKKVKYKAEKIKRQKLIRDARRDLKARLRNQYFGEPYVDETNMTEAEKKVRRNAEKEERRKERRKIREARQIEEEEQMKVEEERQQEELAAKEALKAQRKETAAALKAIEAAEAGEGGSTISEEEARGDQFAAGADEIKLGVNIDGKVRTIPGVGQVDRYPTKGEKRDKKLKAEALEHGMTVDEWKAELEKQREDRERPAKEAAEKLRETRGGLKAPQWRKYCVLAEREGQDVAEKFFVEAVKAIRETEAKKAAEVAGIPYKPEESKANSQTAEPAFTPKPLSANKLAKYAAKAEAKGISVEEYAAQREAKKTAQEDFTTTELNDKGLGAESPNANGVTTLQGSTSKFYTALAEVKAVKAGKSLDPPVVQDQKVSDEDFGFVVDGQGDRDLEAAFMIDTTGDPDILTRPKAPLTWHPDMLGDRKVKELPKELRKARLEWMREKRRERAIAAGKNPMSRKERHKLRVQKKMKYRDKLVAEIMTAKGKPKELANKGELVDARRQAKRQMREEKRVKRNKVIHRKKLGEGLRGIYGGQISNGKSG